MRRRPTTLIDAPGERSGVSPRGLTLFEVLIALSIFVSSIAVISQLLAQGIRGALQAELETEAVLRAESKLSAIVAGASGLQRVQNAPFPDNAAWKFSVEVQPGPAEELFFVEVTVTHSANSSLGAANYSISRLVRDPQVLIEAAAAKAAEAETEE